jgi:APA family basic amino acid/polyamine antiporter
MNIFRKKNITLVRDISEHSKLEKRLGAMDLILMGIGAVIGTGIFVLTGIQAATAAGPAVTLSFVLAGLTCIFVALVYTEIASTVPSAGGAYTFAYISLGEIIAWLVGWVSIIQFCIGSTTVAAGWSGYMVGILEQGGIHLPYLLTHVPSKGGIIDLPASLICLVITFILIRGIKESATFNAILVAVKIIAIFLFLIIATPHFNLENWSNFAPFGVKGIAVAAGAIFMAYTGFDTVANAAEESKNPEKDVTFGLIGSLLVCILLYVLVAGMVTGIVPYDTLNNSEPLAYALKANGSHIGGALVAAGGIAGMTTVILFQIYAQSRIFMAMSRDGLLPKLFSKIHSKYHTPYISTIIIGVSMAVIAGFVPITIMGNLASMATLIVFTLVAISAFILRKNKPNIKRPFKCPAINLVTLIAVASCCYLIAHLIPSVGLIMFIWVLIGLGIYFVYSKNNANKFYKV